MHSISLWMQNLITPLGGDFRIWKHRFSYSLCSCFPFVLLIVPFTDWFHSIRLRAFLTCWWQWSDFMKTSQLQTYHFLLPHHLLCPLCLLTQLRVHHYDQSFPKSLSSHVRPPPWLRPVLLCLPIEWCWKRYTTVLEELGLHCRLRAPPGVPLLTVCS